MDRTINGEAEIVHLFRDGSAFYASAAFLTEICEMNGWNNTICTSMCEKPTFSFMKCIYYNKRGKMGDS